MKYNKYSLVGFLTLGLCAMPFVALGQIDASAPGGDATPGIPKTRPPAHYPGEEMIDVGGHKLQMVRGGQGSPTVVFESGMGGMIANWSRVVPMVNKFTSTVTYARAGTGASEMATGSRTPTAVMTELHVMLERAGIRPPYVIVGHSFGALYARAFATMYPNEVVGIVLIDGSWERSLIDIKKLDSDPKSPATSVSPYAPPAAKAEYAGMASTFASGVLEVPGKLPDVPMVVLTSLKPPVPSVAYGDAITKLKRQRHTEIFESTTYGMHIVTRKSGHNIQRDQPDLVVSAIRWVWDAAQESK